MRKLKYIALSLIISVSLSGCYVTHIEGQKSFSADLQERGTIPYLKHPILKDMEQDIRAIAMAPFTSNSQNLDRRNLQILSNFEGRYDHDELVGLIHLSKVPWDDEFVVKGTNTDCEITPKQVSFPALDSKTNDRTKTYDWTFVRGECKDGLAHGKGHARSTDGKARFLGEFDNGQMIRGSFETKLEQGDKVRYLGEVPAEAYIARALSSYYNKDGFQSHRYGDFAVDGRLNGFGIIVFNYTDQMIVKQVGQFTDSKLNGYGALQSARSHGDGKVWNAWLGNFVNGQMEGLGAWTNAVDALSIGEWVDGNKNGIEYRQYSDMTGDYHSFGVGQRINGKRHGKWDYTLANSFNSGSPLTEVYNHGKLISTSDQPAFSFDQIMAFSMGAAIIGASNIPDTAKLQIGSALAADTLGNGGGTNMASLQSSFAQRAQSVSSGNAGNRSSSSSAGGSGITVEQVEISCPDTGVSNMIPIPYRTQICRRAAIAFATTYACNKLDQERVTRNCKAACGNSQCLQN